MALVGPTKLPQKLVEKQKPVIRLSNLSTIQDRSWIHKITGTANLTSALALLSEFLYTCVTTSHPEITSTTLPLFTVWALSSLGLSVSGTALAVKYEAHLPSQRVFVGAAASLLLNAWMAWWSTPFFPDFLSPYWINATVVAPLCVFATYNVYTTLRDTGPLLDRRRDREAREIHESGRTPKFVLARDFLCYIVPVAYGLPFFAFVYPQLAIFHDRQFIFDVGGPDFGSISLYMNVLAGMNNSIGSFLVTVRDRKVITRSTEMGFIGGVTWATMAVLAYVTTCFPLNTI